MKNLAGLRGASSVFGLSLFTMVRAGRRLRIHLRECFKNLVTVETFGVRDGMIHEVEVFPFVTLPYGLGDGWTPGSGR